jgi:hypothetical protein
MKTARPTAIFYLIVMFFVPLTLAQFSPEAHYKNGETRISQNQLFLVGIPMKSISIPL